MFFTMIIVVLFISCKEKNKVNIFLDNAHGLKEGDKVICKGKEVGEVFSLKFVNRKLNAELHLQKDFLIPKKSEISLVSMDLMGTKAISVELSNEHEYYSDLDTLFCKDRSATKIDTTLMIINSAIKSVTDSLTKSLPEE